MTECSLKTLHLYGPHIQVGNPKRMGSSLSILSVGLWLDRFTEHLTPLLALEYFPENPGGPRSDKVDFP